MAATPRKRTVKAPTAVKAAAKRAASGPSVPSAPENMHAPGRELWEQLLASYELTPVDLVTLTLACRQADDIARLESAIRADGVIVPGSTGQARLSQCVAEVRQGRLALAKLLDQLALPEDTEQVGRTPSSRRAQHAAGVRWDRRDRQRLRLAKEGD